MGEAAYAELVLRCEAHLDTVKRARSAGARQLIPLLVHPATVAAGTVGGRRTRVPRRRPGAPSGIAGAVGTAGTAGAAQPKAAAGKAVPPMKATGKGAPVAKKSAGKSETVSKKATGKSAPVAKKATAKPTPAPPTRGKGSGPRRSS
jgi:hypothetical protein